MESNRSDRQTNKGRPTNAEIQTRPAPTPVQHVESVEKPESGLPAVMPMRCECCGRGMDPRIIRVRQDRRVIRCPLCGGHMSLIYRPNHPVLVEVIRSPDADATK